MDDSSRCMFCKMNGPFLKNRLMLIHRLKLMFNTDMFDGFLLEKNTCLLCAGRILQVFDFYMVKSNVDKMSRSIETSNIKKCTFCLNNNVIIDETDVASIESLAIQTKLIKEVDLNDHIFCCYVCYNFLHHYIILEEILTRETEIFKKQINYNSKNALANEVLHNNKKINPADEEKCDEIVRSKSSRSVLKRFFTESNNASTAQSQSLFNMEAGYGFRNGIDSQVQPLPMTRLPFRILPIIDNIVKIEESELITNSQTSVSDPTVLDTIKTDIYLKHVSNERKNSKTSKRINDSTKKKKKYRKSTFGPKKRRTRKVIEKNCNQKLLQMLKPPLLLEEQSVLKDQETKHPQKVEINEHPIKKSRFRQAQYIKQYQVKQNEQEKNKLREEKKSRENAVISKPDKSDKKSKKNIKKSSNSEKCNIRTKKQFLQLQTNVLIHGHKKKPKQKALEEWRLKFNLSLHEIVLLERCEFPTRIVSVAPQ